jgi:hypothetical protein
MSAIAPKFVVGDQVIYTNPQGVVWGSRTITAVDTTSKRAVKWGPHYYISPTDAPWYAVAESCLDFPELDTAELVENKEAKSW